MNGKAIRIKQLFRNSDRLFIVPMDHGVTIGPVTGLQYSQRTMEQVAAGGVDAVVVHKGLAKQVAHNQHGCQLIIHLSASTQLSLDPNRKVLVSSPEHAVRLGAAAVSVHVNLASPTEAEMLRDLGQTAEKCDLLGIPLLAMMYVRDGTKESEYNPQKIAHAARVAEELGADIVKVNYPGSPDAFADIVHSVNIPVVMAGGPKMSSLGELLTTVRDAVRAGAHGVAVGRNVFQDQSPKIVASLIRRVLDEPSDTDIAGLICEYRMKAPK